MQKAMRAKIMVQGNMNMETEPKVYRTKDLYEAACLYALDCKLVEVASATGKVFWFCFDSEDGVREASQKYWSGEVRVSAKKYADAIRTLKDLIFSKLK